MYSDKGPKVVFGGYAEYDAEFTLDWNKTCSTRLSVAACITKGILADITSQVDRCLSQSHRQVLDHLGY